MRKIQYCIGLLWKNRQVVKQFWPDLLHSEFLSAPSCSSFFVLFCFVFIGLCDYFDFVSLHSISDIHVCGSKLYSYCSLRRRFIFFEWDFHLNVLITVEVTAWSVRSSSSFSSMWRQPHSLCLAFRWQCFCSSLIPSRLCFLRSAVTKQAGTYFRPFPFGACLCFFIPVNNW